MPDAPSKPSIKSTTEFLVYDVTARRWLDNDGAWSDRLPNARRFASYHDAHAVRSTLRRTHSDLDGHEVYVTLSPFVGGVQ